MSFNRENIFSKDWQLGSAITSVRDLRQVKLEESEELNAVLLPQGHASMVSDLIVATAKTVPEKILSRRVKSPEG